MKDVKIDNFNKLGLVLVVDGRLSYVIEQDDYYDRVIYIEYRGSMRVYMTLYSSKSNESINDTIDVIKTCFKTVEAMDPAKYFIAQYMLNMTDEKAHSLESIAVLMVDFVRCLRELDTIDYIIPYISDYMRVKDNQPYTARFFFFKALCFVEAKLRLQQCYGVVWNCLTKDLHTIVASINSKGKKASPIKVKKTRHDTYTLAVGDMAFYECGSKEKALDMKNEIDSGMDKTSLERNNVWIFGW
jgi:hypothetical protein